MSVVLSSVIGLQAAVRVGVFPSSENMHGSEYRDSLAFLGADVIFSQDDADGTRHLVQSLSTFQMAIVPPLHGFSNSRITCHHESLGAYTKELRTWVEAGGILYIDDANYSETLEWLQDLDTEFAVRSSECDASGAPAQWLKPLAEAVRGPRRVEPSTTWGHLTLPDASHTRWQIVGECSHHHPILLQGRLGAGFILVSSIRGWDGHILQNLWVHQKLAPIGLEVESMDLPELFPGTNTLSVALHAKGDKPITACVALTVGTERFEEAVEIAPDSTQLVSFSCNIQSRGRQRAELLVGTDTAVVCCEGRDLFLSRHFNLRPDRIGDGILKPASKSQPELTREGDSYELLILGDTHYDAAYEVYHAQYQQPDERLDRIQREEFARNERLWRVFGPRLLEAMQQHLSPQTRAVLQVGDLVQGDCGDAAVHGQMLLDTLALFHKHFPSIPFLTVIGNHDVRGPGAESAYRKAVLPYLSKELRQPIESTTFSFMLGNDLVVCIDFNSPDVMAIQEAFDAHPQARYKFVLTHGPVIPVSTATSGWYLMGWSDASERRKIRELFLQNDVIVITGHEHAIGLSECITDSGRITQLMANSVWSDEALKELTPIETSPSDFGRLQIERASENGQKLVDEYKRAITRHWNAHGAGYLRLLISSNGITAEFYGGDTPTPIRIEKIRSSLLPPKHESEVLSMGERRERNGTGCFGR